MKCSKIQRRKIDELHEPKTKINLKYFLTTFPDFLPDVEEKQLVIYLLNNWPLKITQKEKENTREIFGEMINKSRRLRTIEEVLQKPSHSSEKKTIRQTLSEKLELYSGGRVFNDKFLKNCEKYNMFKYLSDNAVLARLLHSNPFVTRGGTGLDIWLEAFESKEASNIFKNEYLKCLSLVAPLSFSDILGTIERGTTDFYNVASLLENPEWQVLLPLTMVGELFVYSAKKILTKNMW